MSFNEVWSGLAIAVTATCLAAVQKLNGSVNFVS